MQDYWMRNDLRARNISRYNYKVVRVISRGDLCPTSNRKIGFDTERSCFAYPRRLEQLIR